MDESKVDEKQQSKEDAAEGDRKETVDANAGKNDMDSNQDDFDGYISVCSSEDGSNIMEVPVAEDNTLSIATLAHSFPDAVGLKFKNQTTGIYRTLAVDEQKRCILAPRGGWAGRRYIAIFASTPGDRKRPRNDDMVDLVGEKRSGLDESLNESLRVPVDLIVLNLSFSTTEENLKTFFEQFGEVQYVEVKRDFRTLKPKGYGFVKMKTMDAQNKVLEQSELFIDGRVVQVKVPSHNNANQFEANSRSQEVVSTKLYVGRVWNTLTERDMHDFFEAEAKKISPLAKVERVFIPQPHRGFAFVTLNDPNVTKRLCQIRDFIVRGKSICVSIPAPKKEQPQPHQDALASYFTPYTGPASPSIAGYTPTINYYSTLPRPPLPSSPFSNITPGTWSGNRSPYRPQPLSKVDFPRGNSKWYEQ